MTVFVDASALIAIVTGQPEALTFADCPQSDPLRLCSAMSAWETVAGLCRSYAFSPSSPRARLKLFLDALDFRYVPIGEAEYEVATEAYGNFGKGRHAAALNMGDCFSYACTRTNAARLLFKGDDFTRTDIPSAMG